jgi:membrane-associated protein
MQLPEPSPAAPGPAGTAAPHGPAASLEEIPQRWRPWHGRPRARDLLCLTAIVASMVYSVAMIPLTPLLIASHPLLLEMVAGSNTSVLAGGAFAEVHGTPPVVVVAAALPAMMRSDWILWWAGRLWGQRIVERLGRHNPRIMLAARRRSRLAAPLVALAAFLPAGTQSPLYAAAGWLGLPLPLFLLADAVGTAVWVSLLTALGYLLGRDGVVMAGLISRYALAAICASILAAAAPYAWRAWRRRARAAVAVVPVTAAGTAAGPLGAAPGPVTGGPAAHG